MQYDGSGFHETSRTYLDIDPELQLKALRGVCALADGVDDALFLAEVLGLLPLELPYRGDDPPASSHQSARPRDPITSQRRAIGNS